MAGAAVDALSTRLEGLLVSGPADEGDDLPQVKHFAGEHPLPGSASLAAGRRALEIAHAARVSGRRLLLLLSGGASSMLAAPPPGISLDDKRLTTERLMRAGATIGQLNAVRKHLSALKGGRLAAAAGSCVTLALSDVHDPPDDPATIGSGPTVADPTSYEDALRALDALHVEAPATVVAHLRQGAAGRLSETPTPGDPSLEASAFRVIGNRHTAMTAAAAEARRLGYALHVVGPPTHGEAREAGRRFTELALTTLPPAGPVCVIGSGETTVTIRGDGRGGRNQEFVLGAAPVLAAHASPALVVSVGTDGIDGPTDAAGALVDSTTVSRAGAKAIDRALAHNDSYPLLARLGDLVRWGHTFTNVGDLHILITMGA
jgi:glycerate-2-kinase